MSTRISDLSPKAQQLYQAFKAKLDEGSVQTVVVYTLRTTAEQQALYAQGRKPLSVINAMRNDAGLSPIGPEDNTVVTNCDGVMNKSNHQTGDAFDLTFADENGNPVWPDSATADGSTRWLSLGAIAESVGLKWGGRFAPLNSFGVGWDPDHFEV